MNEMPDRFRALHTADELFVMPNPWDRGSARALQDMGFAALATTSAGFGRSIGKDDQEVTRGELVQHVGELTAMLDVPLNVDSERLFPEDPGGIAETVRQLAAVGAAGLSIEDYNPATGAIDSADAAAAAVAEAAAACAEFGLVLTARCESHLYGGNDVDDTLTRLGAYRAAGADCVYAPGLSDAASIGRVVAEVGGPVNVLALPGTPSTDELSDLGVRRLSLGSLLSNAATKAMKDLAQRYVP